MALTLIDVKPSEDRVTAIVTLASDLDGANAITELGGMDAKREAIKAAQGILVDPRINGFSQHYPVDNKGKPVLEFTPTTKIAAYRTEIQVVSRLV